MKKESEIIFRNPKKRELSSFMAEQLLYDYASKRIDAQREASLNQALQNSPALVKALDDIIYGMTYCHHLQKTTVSKEFLNQFKGSLNWKSKWKRYAHWRSWPKNATWALEALGVSFFILILILVIPWSRLVNFVKDRQKPFLFITEVPKDNTFNTMLENSSLVLSESTVNYKSIAELHSVNPEFTMNKLNSSLPQLGASIEHHSLRKSDRGTISPFLKISIPKNQIETLFAELKSQGQLIWINAPPQDAEGEKIFGMELWIVQQEAPKGKAPLRESNDE